EITVAIEIGKGNAVIDRGMIEAPEPGDFFEVQVAEITKGHYGHVEERIELRVLALGRDECLLQFNSLNVATPGIRKLLNLLVSIQILDIANVTGGDEQVIVTIEVDIEKYGRPGPIARLNARKVRNFGVGAVAAVQ